MNKGGIIILILLLGTKLLNGQDSTYLSNQDIQQLEMISEDLENEDIDFTNLLETLTAKRGNKIDLNKATFEQLQQLHILNDIQINALLKHIETNGSLISLYELQVVPHLDLNTIYKMVPYVKISSNQPFIRGSKKTIHSNNHNLMFRFSQILEEQTGYKEIDSLELTQKPNSRYLGSPQKYYCRYNYNYENKISLGITAEKDPGEILFKSGIRNNYDWYTNSFSHNLKSGFDFYSAHLSVNNICLLYTSPSPRDPE